MEPLPLSLDDGPDIAAEEYKIPPKKDLQAAVPEGPFGSIERAVNKFD